VEPQQSCILGIVATQEAVFPCLSASGWAPVKNISFFVEQNVEIIPTKMARLHFGHVVAPVPVCV
jgi:hypothetical protein